MSSIASLQLKVPIAGETNFISPITDLLRHNSLAYSAFFSHSSLLICNLKLYFSTDGVDFTEYKTITLNNDTRATGNELIPARYFRFSIENPDINAMSLIDVFFTAFVTASSNINVNIGEGDFIDVSGGATEVTQLLVKNAVVSTDGKITVCDTGSVGVSSSVLPIGASTSNKQIDIENKLIEIDTVLDQMKIDTAKIITAPSTEAKQTTANLTLTDISNNLTRVVPTDNAVGECLPVRLMVGSSGSAFNALRAIGQDLATYVDDMNPDAVVNSGIASKALQDSTKLVIDDIDTGINKDRTTDSIYTNAAVTASNVSSSISMGDSKDRYTQIQLVGDSATAGYKFILEYSTDGSNWFSDGVESNHYNNGTRYEFSVSRINISVPFLRVKSIVTGATVNMSYSLTK